MIKLTYTYIDDEFFTTASHKDLKQIEFDSYDEAYEYISNNSDEYWLNYITDQKFLKKNTFVGEGLYHNSTLVFKYGDTVFNNGEIEYRLIEC